MRETEIRKIEFGNTVYELYLCNEDDVELFNVFRKSIYELMECEEDVYNWLRGHDIYYKVSYNRSFKHPFCGYISSRLSFERLKRIFPVSNRALAKYREDDELIQEIVKVFGTDKCRIYEL